MKITVRRVYDFGADARSVGPDLLTPGAWDAARDAGGGFGLAASREEWEREGAASANVARAREVLAVVHEIGATSLCSYGPGGALIEQQLHRLEPGLRITCADFAPRTVQRLRELFDEDVEVVVRDLGADGPLAADLHFMHRIDQELTQESWQRVFAGIGEPVLFVPSEVLTPINAAKEVVRRLVRRHATFAGWFRNEAALRALWSLWFDDRPVTIGGLRGFVLSPRAR